MKKYLAVAAGAFVFAFVGSAVVVGVWEGITGGETEAIAETTTTMEATTTTTTEAPTTTTTTTTTTMPPTTTTTEWVPSEELEAMWFTEAYIDGFNDTMGFDPDVTGPADELWELGNTVRDLSMGYVDDGIMETCYDYNLWVEVISDDYTEMEPALFAAFVIGYWSPDYWQLEQMYQLGQECA